jgi:glucosamine--fructose-6-phosphate aminotransferase (isomerizing)
MLGAGASWITSLIGKFMIEEIAGVPVEVDYAGEFRYRRPPVGKGTVVMAVSQSGETADTLAALEAGRERGAPVLAVCNVVDSSIARRASAVLYTHAGPEISVASTKAFTTQLTALYLLAIHLGRRRGVLDADRARQLISELVGLPALVTECLQGEGQVETIAKKYAHVRDFIFLGRGINHPLALEGALKLKEISYIHAEGYPAAEMKHGPIALIDENMPVVFLCPRDSAYEKVVNNMMEVRARRGRIIAIATEGDTEIARLADHVIFIPQTVSVLQPMLSVIPLQLLAYHIAVMRGCDVDQPRNLAKSVTVE